MGTRYAHILANGGDVAGEYKEYETSFFISFYISTVLFT